MLSSLQTVAVGNWKCSNYFFCAVSFVAPGLEKRGDTLLQSNLSGGDLMRGTIYFVTDPYMLLTCMSKLWKGTVLLQPTSKGSTGKIVGQQ